MGRDYKAEYRRRIERGLAQGRSRSQARGHARAGEASVSSKASRSDQRLAAGLKAFLKTGSLSSAAKQAAISVERLRGYVKRNKLAERHGRGWRPIRRRMEIITRGQYRQLDLGFEAASVNGSHRNAVQRFLETNHIAHLKPFEGFVIIDMSGREYLLETRPNTLYRLAAAGSEGFEQIYRLIV